MFTGIITDIGTITAISAQGTTKRYRVKSRSHADSMALGASIAHNGVCLTVIEKSGYHYDIEASDESLRLTTMKHWVLGTTVNIERALKVGDELGGHWVSGHIDDVAKVTALTHKDGTVLWEFTAPQNLMPYIAKKGSVALNGTSLTVNDVTDRTFTVTMIPHTLVETTWGQVKLHDEVNIEVDVLARYAAKLFAK